VVRRQSTCTGARALDPTVRKHQLRDFNE